MNVIRRHCPKFCINGKLPLTPQSRKLNAPALYDKTLN